MGRRLPQRHERVREIYTDSEYAFANVRLWSSTCLTGRLPRHRYRRPRGPPFPAATLLTAARTVANAMHQLARDRLCVNSTCAGGGGSAAAARLAVDVSEGSVFAPLQQVTAGTADPRFTGRRYMRIEPALTADEDERDQVYEVASTDEAVLISLRPHSERYGSAGRIRLTGNDGGVVTCALERKLEAATAVVTFGNAPVPSHQVCAGQDVVVDFAAGSHNIREYDPATFNIFNPVYLGDAYSARLSGTHTVSGLGASPGGTRHYICAYHETAKFDTECVHTPNDAPLLECLDVACDNGAAQTLCSGDEMSVGVQTGAIALTLTSEFAVPPPPPPIVYGAITAIAQLGADIDGETLGDFFGESVAFNSVMGPLFAAGAVEMASIPVMLVACALPTVRKLLDAAGREHSWRIKQ